MRLPLVLAILLLLTADAASAACVNRFVARTERPNQVVTLLTGKLTFQEAQDLAQKIKAGSAPRLEWIGDDGKVIAKQMGDLKVVRPMPVACDGKSSGVVMIANFLAVHKPTKKMTIRIDPQTTIVFDQQDE